MLPLPHLLRCWRAIGLVLLLPVAAAAQWVVPANVRVQLALPQPASALQVEKSLAQALPQAAGSQWAETYTLQSPYGSYTQYVQTVAGVPLWGSGLKVNRNRDGKVVSAWVNAYPGQLLQLPLPAHTPEVPATALLHSLQASGHAPLYEVTPWYVLQLPDTQWRAVWALSTVQEPGTADSWLRVYDAHTGALLHSQSRALHVARDTSAQGLVYYPNPITTARTSYGAFPEYTDNSDQTNDSLDARRVAVVLRQVTYDETTQLFQLQGPHVRLVNLGGPNLEPVTRTDDTFHYHRGESGFEDVNVYYHIDTVQRYLQALGFDNLANYALQVDAHATTSDNSNFVPAGVDSYIRMGIGGVDDAEDAEVVVHEYGHALSHAASPNTLAGTERLGIEEGNADYLCTSYARRLNPDYGWERLFEWDGHNPFWAGRTATFSQSYNQVMNKSFINIYELAQVWASALMQVWTVHGPAATDPVVFEALYMTQNNLTLPQGVQNLLDADTLVHGGLLSLELYRAFCGYGVLDAATCARYVSRTAATSQLPGTVFPNPATTQICYRADRPLAPTATYKIVDSAGRVWAQGALHSQHCWHTAQWPSGLYLIQIQHNAQFSSQRFVLAP
jgi:hypothetical protein